MSSTILDIKLDSNDSKYHQLRKAFLDELRNNFYVEDYDPIIKYVFTYIFEAKRSKEETIIEMNELFAEQSEEIISWLWNYIEKKIQQKSPKSDLVDEITERERSNRKIERNNKKFNSAIDNFKDTSFRKKKFENKFDKFNDEEETSRIKKIGDKSIILKRNDKRERSRDNESKIISKDIRDTRNRERSFRGAWGYQNKFVREGRYKFNEQNHYSKREYKEKLDTLDKVRGNRTESNELNVEHSLEENIKEKLCDDDKKKKCKNWPNCKNINCEFHHPKETCQFFPKCQFGNGCLNIHPNIPCKYGFYCTRINCSYSHSSGHNPPSYQNFMPQLPAFPHQKYKNLKLDNTRKEGVITEAPMNNIKNEMIGDEVAKI